MPLHYFLDPATTTKKKKKAPQQQPAAPRQITPPPAPDAASSLAQTVVAAGEVARAEQNAPLPDRLVDSDIAQGNFTKRSFRRRQQLDAEAITDMKLAAQARAGERDPVTGETPAEVATRQGLANRSLSAGFSQVVESIDAEQQKLLAKQQHTQLSPAELRLQAINRQTSADLRASARDAALQEQEERRQQHEERFRKRIEGIEDKNERRAERGVPPLPFPESQGHRDARARRVVRERTARFIGHLASDPADLRERLDKAGLKQKPTTDPVDAPVLADVDVAAYSNGQLFSGPDGVVEMIEARDGRSVTYEPRLFDKNSKRSAPDPNRLSPAEFREQLDSESRSNLELAIERSNDSARKSRLADAKVALEKLHDDFLKLQRADMHTGGIRSAMRDQESKIDSILYDFARTGGFEKAPSFAEGQGVGQHWTQDGVILQRMPDGSVDRVAKVEGDPFQKNMEKAFDSLTRKRQSDFDNSEITDDELMAEAFSIMRQKARIGSLAQQFAKDNQPQDQLPGHHAGQGHQANRQH